MQTILLSSSRVFTSPSVLEDVLHLRVSCNDTDPVPPRTTRVAHQTTLKRTSNRTTSAKHVPTAGDIIAARRFAFVHAAPKHGVRPRTLASAPQPRTMQCSVCTTRRQKVRGQVLCLSLNPEPGQRDGFPACWLSLERRRFL